MNKLIENLVNETFSDQAPSKLEWTLIYLSHLKSYWLKEKNWFFPEALIDEALDESGNFTDSLDLDSLFETHRTAKFYAKKNEGENTLIIYAEILDLEQAA